MSSFHYRPRKTEDDNRSEASSQRIIKRKVLRLGKKKFLLTKKSNIFFKTL
jgi:hypothetical protein